MITIEALEKLARQQQTSVFPNIVREYFQHVFLGELYRLPEAERMLFKGGTALRIIYGSPRDFYDLYFMMRKGMLSPDQKKRLARVKKEIIADARKIDFRGELEAFLPADQQAIIRDFIRALESEINRQVA